MIVNGVGCSWFEDAHDQCVNGSFLIAELSVEEFFEGTPNGDTVLQVVSHDSPRLSGSFLAKFVLRSIKQRLFGQI
jgi:hypothetical protein